jgi:hypothetical protein
MRNSERNATGCLGYSTTHMFYGQHPHFAITRWQGIYGAHGAGKCKEFSRRISSMRVPVRGYSHCQLGSGFSIRVRSSLSAIVRGVGDTLAIRFGGADEHLRNDPRDGDTPARDGVQRQPARRRQVPPFTSGSQSLTTRRLDRPSETSTTFPGAATPDAMARGLRRPLRTLSSTASATCARSTWTNAPTRFSWHA